MAPDQELHQWLPYPLIPSSPSNQNPNHPSNPLQIPFSHLSLSSPPPPPSNFPFSDIWAPRPAPQSPIPAQFNNNSNNHVNLDQLRILSAVRAHQAQDPFGPLFFSPDYDPGTRPSYGFSCGLDSVLNRRVLSCSDMINHHNEQLLLRRRTVDNRDAIRNMLITRLDNNNNNSNNTQQQLYTTRSSSTRVINNNHHIHRMSSNGNGFRGRISNGYSTNSSTSIVGILDMELESWEELKGKVVSYAKDQLWSRKLQATLPKLPRDGINLVITETKEDFQGIMYNQFGTHFFQALMDYCQDSDITDFLALVMGSQDFLNICFDDHGTRALQKLVKKLDRKNGDQRAIVASILRGVTLTLSKDTAGHHVLEEFLKAFDGANDVVEPIMEEIVTHCLDIAMDRSGCCLLQKCIKYVQGETGQHLLRHIISYAFELSEHTFGNYVVQYVLEMRNYQYTRDIMMKLKGKFAYLSKNKFGSHVVEKCLEVGTDDQVTQIIVEMVDDPDFVEILQDNFGNYVAQSAHKRAAKSQGLKPVFQLLESRIHSNYPFLHSHLHGKRVLSRIKHSNKYNV